MCLYKNTLERVIHSNYGILFSLSLHLMRKAPKPDWYSRVRNVTYHPSCIHIHTCSCMFIHSHEGKRLTVKNNISCEISCSWFCPLWHSSASAPVVILWGNDVIHVLTKTEILVTHRELSWTFHSQSRDWHVSLSLLPLYVFWQSARRQRFGSLAWQGHISRHPDSS